MQARACTALDTFAFIRYVVLIDKIQAKHYFKNSSIMPGRECGVFRVELDYAG